LRFSRMVENRRNFHVQYAGWGTASKENLGRIVVPA
jgi:hypothetical protein